MVGFILLMGASMTILYEAVARGKERQLALEVEEANKELSVKNEALGSANNQLTGLNQMIQKCLNVIYDERKRLAALATESPDPLKARFQRFIDKINVIAMEPE